jgi:hypothetical protein
MDAIEIMLKEYETLRQEVLAAMSNRNSILSFGLAIIGAIFTASIAADMVANVSDVSSLILILAVPAISIFVVLMWLGEHERTQRAGKFLVDLELRINNKAREKELLTLEEEKLLTWEADLRGKSGHLKYPYIFTVTLLIAIGFISLYIGQDMLNRVTRSMLALVIVVGTMLIVTSVYAISRVIKLQL